MLLHRPSKDEFARLDGRLGKIARLTAVFYNFARLFVIQCTFVQGVLELFVLTGQ